MTQPLDDATRFTFENLPGTESLELTLHDLLNGDLHDPAWRSRVRALLRRCSPGPFEVSVGDPRFDSEPMVVVTNPGLEILAKCGPVKDARSCFDAIFFAATANAIRALLDDPSLFPDN